MLSSASQGSSDHSLGQDRAELPLPAAPAQPMRLQPIGVTWQETHVPSAPSWRPQRWQVQALPPAWLIAFALAKKQKIRKPTEGASVILILHTVCIWWHFYCSPTGTLQTRSIFSFNPLPQCSAQKQVLLLTSPVVPWFPAASEYAVCE